MLRCVHKSQEFDDPKESLREFDDLKAEEEAEEAEALEWQRLREKDVVAAFSAFPRKKLQRLQLKLTRMEERAAGIGWSDAEAESEAEAEARVQNDLEAKLVATEVKAALASDAEAETRQEPMAAEAEAAALAGDAEVVYQATKTVCDLVRQTGTKRTEEFEAAMQWGPHAIVAFPNIHGELHQRLHSADADSSLPRAIARLDERVTAVLVSDPTPIEPWNDAELRAFQQGVVAAADHLHGGKKVLFVCEGGKNRSRAAALAAAQIAQLDDSPLPRPEDANLMRVVKCVVDGDDAGLVGLAPFFPPREKRKR